MPGVRLDEEIGRGGFASVYRGHQLSVDRDVAVKIDQRQLVDARDRRRFDREITAAGAVSAHPHIVTLYFGGLTADDHPFLVMELYPGGSYSDRMKSRGPVPVAEVLDAGFAIADALVAAHGEGILHRDVKPANILISRYGSPALADFGLAALPRAGEGYSVTMESLTPSYAPPEAFGGADPTMAADVYALGATLYAMLRGRSPRSDHNGVAPPIARLLALLNEPLPPVGVPGSEELMLVLWRATAMDPLDRYPSAAAFRDALAAVRSGRPAPHGLDPFAGRADPTGSAGDPGVSSGQTRVPAGQRLAQVTGPAHPAAGRPDRRRVLTIAAVTFVVLVAAVTVALLVGRNRSTASAGPTTGARPPISNSAVAVPLAGASSGAASVVAASDVGSAGPADSGPPAASSSGMTPPTSTSTSVITTSSTSPRSTVVLSTVAPTVGSCWNGLVNVGAGRTAVQIDCGRRHVWEAYATGVLDSRTPTAAASDVLIDPVVNRTCTVKVLQAWAPSAQGKYDLEVLPPSQAAFDRGERGFWCLIALNGQTPVSGSIKSGR